MSIQAVHHSPYRSTVLAAGATALVIGGLAAAGLALSSTTDSAGTVSPSHVQRGPLPGVHDFTAPGVQTGFGSSPLVPHDRSQVQVRRATIPRG